MGGMMMRRVSSSLAFRFKVKGAGIVGFFLLASLYSWRAQEAHLVGVTHHRNLLESQEAAAGVAAPKNVTNSKQCESVATEPQLVRCEMARLYCAHDSGRSMVNYLILHYCALGGSKWLSVPVLVLILILAFYILAETAESHFSPVVHRLVEILGLTPSMGGVTLLALGNGAPDIFASLAAIGGDNSRIGFGAILSAGTFVSAFVVGSVAMAAAPFQVEPMPFVRDVMFYLGAVALLFGVYLRGEVAFWQAVGMVAFYVVFVVVVVCTDRKKEVEEGLEGGGGEIGVGDGEKREKKFVDGEKKEKDFDEVEVSVDVASFEGGDDEKVGDSCLGENCWDSVLSPARGFGELFSVEEVITALNLPISILLKSTIPETNPTKLSRTYNTANIILCPLVLLYMSTSLVSLNRHIAFLSPSLRLLIWLLLGSLTGAAYYLGVTRTHFLAITTAFIMSVFWISLIAGELLGCLATLGIILGVSPALLGLTVLAWGNSIGDLVADVAVARAGQPSMAVAGCFAGPMFNMLVGLGSALCLRTFKEFPVLFRLDRHPGILVAFAFLTLNLLGTLSVVSASGFRLTRAWGQCLIAWYALFMVVSVVVAQVASVGNLT